MENTMNNTIIIALTIFVTILAALAYYVSGTPFSTWTVTEGRIALVLCYVVAYLLWKDN